MNRQPESQLPRPRRRAAAAPHKGPSFAVGSPPSIGSMSYLHFRRGGAMFLVLTLFRWCAVLGECRCPNIFPFNSRLGEFNSRLGGLISRFGLLREIAGNGVIQLTIFPTKRRLSGQIDDFSRFDGKNRESHPHRPGYSFPTMPPISGGQGWPSCRLPTAARALASEMVRHLGRSHGLC